MDVGLHFDVETVPSGQAEPRTGASEPLVFEVEELDRAPRPTLQIPPVYPYRARARNIEGYVDLLFTLTAEGRVTGVTVLETMPGDVFVDAAVRAVEAWRFEPGTKGGKPVAVRMKVKLRFELD
jgi:protein TonB